MILNQQSKYTELIERNNSREGGGVLPEKLGRGVQPAPQNPYPIYDQNLRFSLPYLWPYQKLWYPIYDLTLKKYPVSDLPLIISLVQTNVEGNVYLLFCGWKEGDMMKK